MNNSNRKNKFSLEWVNTLEKKSLQSENIEEKHQLLSLWEIKTEEKNLKVEEVFIEEKKSVIFKKEYETTDERNSMIQYAYDLWGWDLVALMECENSTRNPFRQSEVVKNWRREPSFWLCMIDKDFHPEIINDWRFWEDWRFQVETCHRLRKWWTKFYWPWRWIAKAGMKCSDYVKDRFIIK